MSNSIDAAIAKAQAAAGELAGNLPVIDMAPVEGAVASYAPAQVATLDGFLDSGSALKVDHWLRMEATGFYVKNHDIALPDLGPCLINVRSDMVPFYGLRVMVAGKATYYSSTDQVTCRKTGRPWNQLILEAANGGSRPYKGFDVRLVVTQDVKDLTGKVVVTAGQSLGYSTSVTNFADAADFARKAREQGLSDQDLKVTVTCEKRVNDKNPKGWGALIFGAFAAANDDAPEDEAAAAA